MNECRGKRFHITVDAVIGRNFEKAWRFLKRRTERTDEGFLWSGDERQVEKLLPAMSLTEAKGADCPGMTAMGHSRDSLGVLSKDEAKLFRSAAGRALYISADLWDIMYACRQVMGGRSVPTVGRMAKLKRLCRYLKAQPAMYISEVQVRSSRMHHPLPHPLGLGGKPGVEEIDARRHREARQPPGRLLLRRPGRGCARAGRQSWRPSTGPRQVARSRVHRRGALGHTARGGLLHPGRNWTPRRGHDMVDHVSACGGRRELLNACQTAMNAGLPAAGTQANRPARANISVGLVAQAWNPALEHGLESVEYTEYSAQHKNRLAQSESSA